MKRTIIIIFSLLAFLSCGSGPGNPSIRNTIKKDVSDTISLGLREYRSGNLNSAKSYYTEALMESYSIDNTALIIDINQKLSELSMRLSNYTDASNYIFAANTVMENENSKEFDFIIYLTIGKYYEKAYDNSWGYEKALEYYMRAAGSATNAQDRASAYNNIGIAEKKLKKPDEAVKWFESSILINEAEHVYDALGDNYYYLGEISDERLDYPSALLNYQSALKYDKIAEKSYSILDDLQKIAADYSKTGQKAESAYFYDKALHTAVSLNAANEIVSISNSILQLKNSP